MRERAHEMLSFARAERLRHFSVELPQLASAAAYVAETVRTSYPDLAVPYHSRWRHFVVEGEDRWKALCEDSGIGSVEERTRARFDLAVTSVLLDAGAGEWRYRDRRTGRVLTRSEGLAVASLDLFADGVLSAHPSAKCRADGPALGRFSSGMLRAAFQVTSANPLPGVEGRVRLLNALARCLRDHPRHFGEGAPRVGNLFDYLRGRAVQDKLSAREILVCVLEVFSSIWPGRLQLAGENLGDCWRHPLIARADATNGLIPFHKLSQWLTYSLVEPLEEAGIEVDGLDELTGLAEYRNGGLFLDLGVIVPRQPAALRTRFTPDSSTVVEWRALTVALLDEIAPLVRAELGVDAAEFPLAKVLEGGTWSAGRRIAAQMREGGAPPIEVASDGTVF